MRTVRPGYLSLGSNRGDRARRLLDGLRALGESGVEVEAVSSGYETEPVGEVLDQREFLNAAARVRTALEPLGLLEICKRIELDQGRDPTAARHSPRPLDIDILLLGEIELSSERLTIPHPSLLERRFVLVPVLEIEPGLRLPDGTALAAALEGLGPGQRVVELGPLAELAEGPEATGP